VKFSDRQPARKDLRAWSAWIAFGLAISASAFLLLHPAQEQLGGAGKAAMLQFNGPVPVLFGLFFPVAISALYLMLRSQISYIVSAIAMVVFALVAGFSVGFYYLPSAAALVVPYALAWNRRGLGDVVIPPSGR